MLNWSSNPTLEVQPERHEYAEGYTAKDVNICNDVNMESLVSVVGVKR